MLNADFPAETANKRPSLVDILSGPAPRSPVRAARFDASPHIILTWAYLRLLKFLLSEAKRLFQQYRPKADIGQKFCCDAKHGPLPTMCQGPVVGLRATL